MVCLALLRLTLVLIGLNVFGHLEAKECNPRSFRLPRHIRPDHYKLSIKPDLVKGTFQGLVKITLHVNKDALDTGTNLKEIVLHADKELTINEVNFVSEGNNDLFKVTDWCRDTANDQTVVSFDRELKPSSKGRLVIAFGGRIREDRHGLYRSLYKEIADVGNGYIAVTQFQEAHARKVFPCFDEPEFKATFDVTIEHAKGLKALSNMHPISEQTVSVDGSEYTRVEFARTPIMPTYLLAFTIGQFDHTKTIKRNGMAITVWTPPGKAHLGEFLLNDAARIYAKLSDYFGIDQPIKKIDFVCVRDLEGGAMENWGLVTVSEDEFLVDAKQRSPIGDITARSVLALTLAYNWLGNLVTMRWWDDAWLNVGQAVLIRDTINRELYADADFSFLYPLIDSTLELDADATGTHPIKNFNLKSEEDISKAHDAITFVKAPEIFRMLRDHIGDDTFKLGLRSYLKDNLNGNTEASQLWDALEAASGIGVKELAASWIEQAGFPLVTVKLSKDGKRLELSQMRFNDKSCGEEDISNSVEQRHQKWIIPVSLLVSDGRAGRVEEIKGIMNEETLTIKLSDWFDVSKSGHWVKLNPNFGGFYRVHYDDERLFSALEKPIREKLLAPADRFNLMSDAMALLFSQKIKWKKFKEQFVWYDDEDSDVVVSLFLSKLSAVQLEALETDTSLTWKDFFSNYLRKTGSSGLIHDQSPLKQLIRGDAANVIDSQRYGSFDSREFQQDHAPYVPADLVLPSEIIFHDYDTMESSGGVETSCGSNILGKIKKVGKKIFRRKN